MRSRPKTHPTRARADAQRAARRSLRCARKRNDANMHNNIIYMTLTRIMCNTSVRTSLEPKMTPKIDTKNDTRVSDSARRGLCVRTRVRSNVCAHRDKNACGQAFERSISCITQFSNFRPRPISNALHGNTSVDAPIGTDRSTVARASNRTDIVSERTNSTAAQTHTDATVYNTTCGGRCSGFGLSTRSQRDWSCSWRRGRHTHP